MLGSGDDSRGAEGALFSATLALLLEGLLAAGCFFGVAALVTALALDEASFLVGGSASAPIVCLDVAAWRVDRRRVVLSTVSSCVRFLGGIFKKGACIKHKV